MKRILTLSLIVTLLTLMIMPAHAQTGSGQVCVRAYDDRNGDGKLSVGEPPLTAGLSAELLKDGIVIASALLDKSPTAATGIICFTALPAGQYGVTLTSAAHTATTPSNIIANVNATGTPTIVEFGGKLAEAPAVVAPAADLSENDKKGLLIAGLATLLVIAGMVVLGVIVYLIAFRRKPARMTIQRSTGTGQLPRV